MKLLFIDMVYPKEYSEKQLDKEPMGGTESTVLRIVTALSKNHSVVLVQANRQKMEIGKSTVVYRGLDFLLEGDLKEYRPDFTIHIRGMQAAPSVDKVLAHQTKHILWAHDLAGSWLAQDYQILKELNTKIVGVSNFHKHNLIDLCLRQEKVPSGITVSYIHNPIPNELAPKGIQKDKYTLVYASSPHKGLEYALEIFRQLRNVNSKFKLKVFNPGYYIQEIKNLPGVETIGPVAPDTLHDAMESALAVIHPCQNYPETFGLVYAESLAVGTPILTHPIGAASEVIQTPEYVTDMRNAAKCVDILVSWAKDGVPPIKTNLDKFRLDSVVKQWETMLVNMKGK